MKKVLPTSFRLLAEFSSLCVWDRGPQVSRELPQVSTFPFMVPSPRSDPQQLIEFLLVFQFSLPSSSARSWGKFSALQDLFDEISGILRVIPRNSADHKHPTQMSSLWKGSEVSTPSLLPQSQSPSLFARCPLSTSIASHCGIKVLITLWRTGRLSIITSLYK